MVLIGGENKEWWPRFPKVLRNVGSPQKAALRESGIHVLWFSAMFRHLFYSFVNVFFVPTLLYKEGKKIMAKREPKKKSHAIFAFLCTIVFHLLYFKVWIGRHQPSSEITPTRLCWCTKNDENDENHNIQKNPQHQAIEHSFKKYGRSITVSSNSNHERWCNIIVLFETPIHNSNGLDSG